MTQQDSSRELLLDLLATRATEGLPEADASELAALLPEFADVDELGLELAAASLELAGLGEEHAALPESLGDRVLTAIESARTAPTPRGTPVRARGVRAVGTRGRAPARRRARGLIPWSVAAASLLLAAYLAFPPGPSERPLAELRSDLVADASDVVVVGWTSNDDPAAAGGVEGDVVWSTTLQRGYLRFRGLEVNDPTKSQYQLWIFDREQDERYPIDGGVFDVGAEGETIVSIDPRIRVADPYLFAVTIEKPGGVVVSTRERLPVLAKLGS